MYAATSWKREFLLSLVESSGAGEFDFGSYQLVRKVKCNKLVHKHLSDQGTFTSVGAQGGAQGGPRDTTVENHFPSRILQWNLHHICMDYGL